MKKCYSIFFLNWFTHALLLTFLVFSLNTITALADGWDSSLVTVLKSSNISTLEEGLANTSVSDWVNETFKKGDAVKWEVNDCGEGGAKTPVCVAIQIPQRNGYFLHINFAISSLPQQEVMKPKLWMVYYYKSKGYKTIDSIHLRTIKEAVSLYHTHLSVK